MIKMNPWKNFVLIIITRPSWSCGKELQHPVTRKKFSQNTCNFLMTLKFSKCRKSTIYFQKSVTDCTLEERWRRKSSLPNLTRAKKRASFFILNEASANLFEKLWEINSYRYTLLYYKHDTHTRNSARIQQCISTSARAERLIDTSPIRRGARHSGRKLKTWEIPFFTKHT